MIREILEKVSMSELEYFPPLNSQRDIADYLEKLYQIDTPEYDHYIHIMKSLKRIPMFMDLKTLKMSEGLYGAIIGQEKRGLKRKFNFEIDGRFIQVFMQTQPRQKVTNFEHYKEYSLEDLM